MTRSKCLAMRWRSFTRPTRTPMAAAPLGEPRATARAVGPVVPSVAVRGERAAASLDPGGGDVEEDQAAGGEVAPRGRPLDGRLAGPRPVGRALQPVPG